MMYFDQLATISKHLKNITYDRTNNLDPIIHKIDRSATQTKRLFLKMFHAVATQGTVKATKAILPKNKRSSTKLTRQKLKKVTQMEPMVKQ